MKQLLFLVAIWFFLQSANAQQTNNCPSKIGYSATYPCLPAISQPGFYLVYEGPYSGPLPTGTLTTNFDPSGPNCQSFPVQTTSWSCGSGWLIDIQGPFCMIEKPTGSVTFSNGMVCYYTDGLLQSGSTVACENLLQNCPRPLIELAKDFIGPKDPDCKYWHGPCASENKVWREGTVSLGSAVYSYSGGPFNLIAKGGITTDLLQICVPEWCDYVFDDTFRLRPLPEVAAFIQANGHLPGCTPAKAIEAEGGFYLEKEKVGQQEKIEEVFLHLFDLRKRMDKLDAHLPLAPNGKMPGSPIQDIPEIRFIQPNTGPDASPQITCFQIAPAQTGMPNGTGGVTVMPGPGPFNLAWSGGQLYNVLCDGPIRIQGLSAGLHSVTVSDATGQLGVCGFTISAGQPTDCTVFNDPDCRAAIIAMLEEEAFDTPLDCIQWEGDPCSSTDNMYRLGKVGIGTSVIPSGYSLAVKGGITSDKIRIELCESANWCDYVFDDEYPLLALPEVEKYVQEHRHLPRIVSQAEVIRDGGFELRSVTLAQQEKIEEAFLYLIQLENKKKALQERLNSSYEKY